MVAERSDGQASAMSGSRRRAAKRAVRGRGRGGNGGRYLREMLALDREVAAERGLNIRVIEASMDDLSALSADKFEIVLQPVSTCYVPDVAKVYREVVRVTAAGGLYISQHKQPTSLQAEVRPSGGGYHLTEPYYRTGPLPPVTGSPHREPGTLEYLHRWEELLGGLCRAGFVIEDVMEPLHARAMRRSARSRIAASTLRRTCGSRRGGQVRAHWILRLHDCGSRKAMRGSSYRFTVVIHRNGLPFSSTRSSYFRSTANNTWSRTLL